MFADSGLSDEMAEKIVAFVDREAGRDAPLSADDEAMIRQMIADDPAVRDLVEELRATNAGLDTLLDDVAAVEVPERLTALIRGHGSDDVAVMTPASDPGSTGGVREEADDGDVVTFSQPAPRHASYGPLAAAASIALLICSGALYQVYTSSNAERTRLQAEITTVSEQAEDQGRALADARAELSRLTGIAEQASAERRETTDQLLTNEVTIQELEVARAELEGRYAALEGENQRLSERLDERRSDVASSETERDRLAADLAEARLALAEAKTSSEELRETLSAEVATLEARLEERDQRLAALGEELQDSEQRAAATIADLARTQSEQADLERRLAAAELSRQQLQATAAAAEAGLAEALEQRANLETAIEDSSSRLATVVAGLTAAEAGRQEALQQVVGLEADLAASRSWLGQIAQYHRVYASTARRHLVEVSADELDHIQQWLSTMLGRQIIVPDLTQQGVTFAGARLLAINDNPVAQLVYLDADDQPLALCIIPSSGAAKNPTLSTNGDLNLVDWRDGRHGYALVGWSDPDLLSSLTAAIQPVYDL